MKTITLSDVDVQTIVDALRFKHGLLVSALMGLYPEPTKEEPKEEPKPAEAKYGLKKDGTPRKAPGRPRK